MRVGVEHLRKNLPAVLEDADNALSGRARTILATLREEWVQLETKIDAMTEEIGRISRSNDGCRRLMGVPGIGPIISTALVAAIGDETAFRRGRNQTGPLVNLAHSKAFDAVKLVRSRGRGVHHGQKRKLHQNGRIHCRRPLLLIRTFRLQLGGGPYIAMGQESAPRRGA
jgi:transposase